MGYKIIAIEAYSSSAFVSCQYLNFFGTLWCMYICLYYSLSFHLRLKSNTFNTRHWENAIQMSSLFDQKLSVHIDVDSLWISNASSERRFSVWLGSNHHTVWSLIRWPQYFSPRLPSIAEFDKSNLLSPGSISTAASSWTYSSKHGYIPKIKTVASTVTFFYFKGTANQNSRPVQAFIVSLVFVRQLYKCKYITALINILFLLLMRCKELEYFIA